MVSVFKITCEDLARAVRGVKKDPVISSDQIRYNLVYKRILPYRRYGNGPYYLKPEGIWTTKFREFFDLSAEEVKQIERALGLNFKRLGQTAQVA